MQLRHVVSASFHVCSLYLLEALKLLLHDSAEQLDRSDVIKLMLVCLPQANWIERGLKSMLGLFSTQKGPRPGRASGDWFTL